MSWIDALLQFGQFASEIRIPTRSSASRGAGGQQVPTDSKKSFSTGQDVGFWRNRTVSKGPVARQLDSKLDGFDHKLGDTLPIADIPRAPPSDLRLNLKRRWWHLTEARHQKWLRAQLPGQVQWHVEHVLDHERNQMRPSQQAKASKGRHVFFIQDAGRELDKQIQANHFTDDGSGKFAGRLGKRFTTYRQRQAMAIEHVANFIDTLAQVELSVALAWLSKAGGAGAMGLTAGGQALLRKVLADYRSSDPALKQARHQVCVYCANLLLQQATRETEFGADVTVGGQDTAMMARIVCQGFNESARYLRTHGRTARLHRPIKPDVGLKERVVDKPRDEVADTRLRHRVRQVASLEREARVMGLDGKPNIICHLKALRDMQVMPADPDIFQKVVNRLTRILDEERAHMKPALEALAELERDVRDVGLDRCRRVHEQLAELRRLSRDPDQGGSFKEYLKDVKAEVALLVDTRARMEPQLESIANCIMDGALGNAAGDAFRPDPLAQRRLAALKSGRSLLMFNRWLRWLPLPNNWRVKGPLSAREMLVNELFTMTLDIPLSDEERSKMRQTQRLPETDRMGPEGLFFLLSHRASLPEVHGLALNSLLARVQFPDRSLNNAERRYREAEVVRLKQQLQGFTKVRARDTEQIRTLQPVFDRCAAAVAQAESDVDTNKFVQSYRVASTALKLLGEDLLAVRGFREKMPTETARLLDWIAMGRDDAQPTQELLALQDEFITLIEDLPESTPDALRGKAASDAKALKTRALVVGPDDTFLELTQACLLRLREDYPGGYSTFQRLDAEKRREALTRIIQQAATRTPAFAGPVPEAPPVAVLQEPLARESKKTPPPNEKTDPRADAQEAQQSVEELGKKTLAGGSLSDGLPSPASPAVPESTPSASQLRL